MLEASYQPKEIEESIRIYWESHQIRKRVEKRDDQEKTVGYVEGPPTLNGEPHIGHIRGRFYKDLWFRYATLAGKNVIFRGGWDTQGLPVELQAAKELGIAGGKQEIINFGMEKLVMKAKEMIKKYYLSWITSDRLLGVMMDHDKDYWTYKDEFIEREWQILKAAWEEGLMGESYRVVGYCPSCQTALSHSEVSSQYEMLEDHSLYYKAKLKGYGKRFIVLWTTMPFTLITDEMVAANPSAKYSIVEVKNEEWIIASSRLNDLMKELGIEVFHTEKEIDGGDLEGERYNYPLSEEVPKQVEIEEKFNTHVIILDDSVDISTGTGLVHMSPSNGEVDFDLAQREGLPTFNPFDESVNFTSEAGKYSGTFVRDTDAIVIEDLRKKDLLVLDSKIVHEYPTCWRSHHRLIWLARREYFYWVDRIGERALEAAENVEYFFDAPKHRFLNIIKEMKPWCISRERVWGAPLPIWACSVCGEKNALFSRREIIENSLELPDGKNFELHRPWIDRIVIKCRKCGGKAFREPFVLDTWHNSGSSQYAAFTDQEYEKYVPVEFLTEGIDQTRGWAYSLLILSVIFNKAPKSAYKSFLFQGHILGPDETKMSKSLGNIIDGNRTLTENSVDAIRFYLAWKISPISTLVFNPNEISGRPFQVLNTLYHLHIYFQQNGTIDHFDDKKYGIEWALNKGKIYFLDKWILSRTQRAVDKTVNAYSKAEYNEAARVIECFIIEELSQKYIPSIRKELWTDDPKSENRRMTVYAVLSYCLKTLDLLLHPISPFITEKLYIECFRDRRDSILMENFPTVRRELVKEEIEEKFLLIDRMISETNALRMKAKLKRRWPVEKVVFVLEKEVKLSQEEEDMLKDAINAKQLEVLGNIEKAPIQENLKPNMQILGRKLKKDLPKLLEYLNKEDTVKLSNRLKREKEVVIMLGRNQVKLEENDFQYVIEPKRGFEFKDAADIKIFMKTERNEALIKEGALRDIARRIQAYRKEIGLNPTKIVNNVQIWSDDEELIETIKEKEDELKFLVRSEKVTVEEDFDPDWKMEEMDDRKIRIHVEH